MNWRGRGLVALNRCGTPNACKHGDGHLAGKALSAFNICDLIHRKLTQVCQFLLTHICVEAEFLDSDPKTWLDGLYPLHTSKFREKRNQ